MGGAVAFWLVLVVRAAIDDKPTGGGAVWSLLVATVVVPLVGVGYMLASWIVDALWARRPLLAALVGVIGLLVALQVSYVRGIRPKGLAASEIVETRLLPANAVDWDEALRRANRRMDLLAALLRAGSAEERQRARAELDAEEGRLATRRQMLAVQLERATKSEAMGTVGLAAAIEQLGDTVEGRRRLAVLANADEPVLRVGVFWNEVQTQFRVGVLAVALARHRFEHGGYPADLKKTALPRPPLPGYVLHYHAGARGSGEATPHRTFALTAVPEEPGETGVRGFCIDPTGQTRVTSDSSEPRLLDGLCDPRLPGLG